MLEMAENGKSHGRIDCLGLARITTPSWRDREAPGSSVVPGKPG